MLAAKAPELERILTSSCAVPAAAYAAATIRRESVWVTMRDGIRLATDLYLPPVGRAPAIALRTPYGRANKPLIDALLALSRCGYAVISQDCRGTGESEPDVWDYYVYEAEDGFDLVEWVSRQEWCDGFIGACGGSYAGQTQWSMALHPRMSTIVPEVSGLGIAVNTAHLHMTLGAYARSVGKGGGKVPIHYGQLERLMLQETLSGGLFIEPLHPPFSNALLHRYPQISGLPFSHAQRWLWDKYCTLSAAERAEFVRQATGESCVGILETEGLSKVFGHRISHDAHSLPHAHPRDLCRSIHATALMITGWYDWGLNDALATWALLRSAASDGVRARSRLIITPSAHNKQGYKEGAENHPELQRSHRTEKHPELLLCWYCAVRDGSTDAWPRVIYYLMGANRWRIADDWPPPGARTMPLYLGSGGILTEWPPPETATPDSYTYWPNDPTPTVGGSIVSEVYPTGSVDVSAVQQRPDVLAYTTAPMERDLDVVGPLRLVLYASTSAVDTDFCARISDVFPDGRAIQLQSGILRARYRNVTGEPELLESGKIYRLEIDLWATANRFKVGHSLRLDLSSADFPRFDRNSNSGGEAGPPLPAMQTIYHDYEHPSHLVISTLDGQGAEA